MSWRIEVIADNSGQWCPNGIRVATKAEAEAYAHHKMMSWILVRDTRVLESDDPVNYQWNPERGLLPIESV